MTRISKGSMNGWTAIVLLAALSMAASAAGQVQPEPVVWTGASVQGHAHAGSAWRFTSDSLVRTRDGTGTFDVQASVVRDLTRETGVGIGYAYRAGFPDAKVREQRFMQDFTWSAGAATRVALRSRFEERFVSGLDGVAVRARQQVRVSWPLASKARLRGVASEELSVHANSTANVHRGIDSNRAFIGVRRTLSRRSGVEIGYLNVYARGASGRTVRSHVMSVTLVVAL